MASRRRRPTNETLPLWQEPERGIRPHAAGERLATLLKERERWLRDVQRKKLALEQLAGRAQESANLVMEKLAPFVARHEAIAAELSKLFDELLAPGRLSASARKKVARVRRILQERGALDLEPCSFSPDGDDCAAGPPFTADAEPEPVQDAPHAGHGAREVASAPQRGQGPGREALRELFRRLARDLHPDHAQHDQERERRTEAMKQITQAYQDGDLARLIELEKAWRADEQLPAGGEENEARCREIERTIRELRSQANEPRRELRRIKYSSAATALDTRVDLLIAQGEVELREFESIRDLVRSFRDGEITLARFLQGPEPYDDEGAEFRDFSEMVDELIRRTESATKRKTARARTR